jgi:hypothetical protein
MENINTLKEKITGLTERTWLVDFYIKEAQKLEKKDSILRIADFDDTLFGRRDQLEAETKLKELRWDAGTTFILNEMWVHTYIEKYYKWVTLQSEILDLLDKNTDIILTAGMKELQTMKIRAVDLDSYNLKIVDFWEDKILESIRYVLFELRYIPTEIVVYEDRPQYFIEYRELIEWILWTKLTIMFVEMDWNEGYKSIKEV